ncbi:MAG: MBL fold metallo-hydrolase [Promethearchaeota archaeon]|jgi:glyoxylase-like metal-dependent hydrolase (beta-lactamase superfamily II)
MNDFIRPLSDDFKNIYFIEGERKGNYPYSNSLLINDCLIDTGISTRYMNKLIKEFQINSVLLSHWHEDHIPGNHLLENSKFMCHAKDKDPIEDIEMMYTLYRVENTPAGDDFRALIGMMGMKNTKIYKTFEDDEIIDVGDDLGVKVIFTPGHTAGHCAFIEMNSKIAFFGDIDLTRFPYYATIDSNLMELEKSIEQLKVFDINVAVLGHREIVIGKNVIKEELDKFKSVIYKRDERILSNLSENQPIRPIDLKDKNLIYRRYSYNFEVISELVMIEKHFDKYLSQDLITPKEDGFILN